MSGGRDGTPGLRLSTDQWMHVRELPYERLSNNPLVGWFSPARMENFMTHKGDSRYSTEKAFASTERQKYP